jgi:hypothetical protein
MISLATMQALGPAEAGLVLFVRELEDLTMVGLAFCGSGSQRNSNSLGFR